MVTGRAASGGIGTGRAGRMKERRKPGVGVQAAGMRGAFLNVHGRVQWDPGQGNTFLFGLFQFCISSIVTFFGNYICLD